MSSIDVMLVAPSVASPALPGINTRSYSSERDLRVIVDGAAIAVVPGALFSVYPSLARTPARLVLDASNCREVCPQALRAVEFVLCGSQAERQRWICFGEGGLGSANRRLRSIDRDSAVVAGQRPVIIDHGRRARQNQLFSMLASRCRASARRCFVSSSRSRSSQKRSS